MYLRSAGFKSVNYQSEVSFFECNAAFTSRGFVRSLVPKIGSSRLNSPLLRENRQSKLPQRPLGRLPRRGRKWPKTDRRLLSNDPINNCGTDFVPFKWLHFRIPFTKTKFPVTKIALQESVAPRSHFRISSTNPKVVRPFNFSKLALEAKRKGVNG